MIDSINRRAMLDSKFYNIRIHDIFIVQCKCQCKFNSRTMCTCCAIKYTKMNRRNHRNCATASFQPPVQILTFPNRIFVRNYRRPWFFIPHFPTVRLKMTITLPNKLVSFLGCQEIFSHTYRRHIVNVVTWWDLAATRWRYTFALHDKRVLWIHGIL